MSSISLANKVFLEEVLGMKTGYVLDFSNASFARLFEDIGIDIYDREEYAGFGDSKAERLRALWKRGSDAEVSAAVDALADYIDAKEAAGGWEKRITTEQVARMRKIAGHLRDLSDASSIRSTAPTAPVAITTEATATKNLISIEIHEDIYTHIQQYLVTGDYFHAVEESYKVVRERLRELTGSERATDVFNENAQSNKHYAALFGKATPVSSAEADFFRGVGYLHLGVQFLRNEKAHALATPVEPNLAIHYISLASLAYDLITRYVSDTIIKEIEDLVLATRRGYQSVRAFYADFENGKWLQNLEIPTNLRSASVCKVLKEKWLEEADFTRSYDHSNVVLMRLELVVDELTQADLDRLLDLPTTDEYGNDQQAGMLPFLDFVAQRNPGSLSQKAREWIAAKNSN